MENINPNGLLDNDWFLWALLQMWNTPDAACNQSGICDHSEPNDMPAVPGSCKLHPISPINWDGQPDAKQEDNSNGQPDAKQADDGNPDTEHHLLTDSPFTSSSAYHWSL